MSDKKRLDETESTLRRWLEKYGTKPTEKRDPDVFKKKDASGSSDYWLLPFFIADIILTVVLGFAVILEWLTFAWAIVLYALSLISVVVLYGQPPGLVRACHRLKEKVASLFKRK